MQLVKYPFFYPGILQIGLILPQWGHLMLNPLKLGGSFNFVPQSQVMVL